MTTTTKTLPSDIGGYQHLARDVICQEGDIYVMYGKPHSFVGGLIGHTVERAESYGLRVYRRMPVASHCDTTPLPTDAKARKGVPIYSGFIRYFPLAIAAVARLSQVGNEQHNPGQPLHWDRGKSGDELDALARHLVEADSVDTDGVPHVVKCAWRAMAAAEKYLEAQQK